MGPVCADVDDCAWYLWWDVAAGQERTIMLPKTYDNWSSGAASTITESAFMSVVECSLLFFNSIVQMLEPKTELLFASGSRSGLIDNSGRDGVC